MPVGAIEAAADVLGLRVVLGGTLTETRDPSLAQTTIVHCDFHHRNFLVEDGRVTGVFDWDIATPGDWRFDLVCLAFVCQMYPKTCEPDALATVITAVHEHCDVPTAAFLMACQTLRRLSSCAVISLIESSLRVGGCR